MPARAGAHQGAPSASTTDDAIMGILDMLQEHLGPGQVQQISQQIGATPQQTETAVQAALPMMLGGMAGRAQQPDGGDSIMQALGGLGGGAGAGGLAGALGGMLGGGGGGGGGLGGALGGALGGMLGGDGPGGGGGILGSILGGNEGTVEDGVSRASGLDGSQARKLLMILAPIVLGMIAKRHGNASGGALGGALQEDAREAREQAERNQPGMGGILGDILGKVQTGR